MRNFGSLNILKIYLPCSPRQDVFLQSGILGVLKCVEVRLPRQGILLRYLARQGVHYFSKARRSSSRNVKAFSISARQGILFRFPPSEDVHPLSKSIAEKNDCTVPFCPPAIYIYIYSAIVH